MKIVTADQMTQIEARAVESGLTIDSLMENAGRAVAESIRREIRGVLGKRILVLIGPGKNGGDGLVAARHLHDWGARVTVYMATSRSYPDPRLAKLSSRLLPGLSVNDDISLGHFKALAGDADIVVDAVFGTGHSRPLAGPLASILEILNAETRTCGRPFVVSVDLPSGLDPDTGSIDSGCLKADVTVTLGLPKIGLFAFPGASMVGKLEVADIGIPSAMSDDVSTHLIDADLAGKLLPARPGYSNKGTFGKVLVVAGSVNYVGAAYLTCVAASRSGCGRVTLAALASILPILASKLIETTYLPIADHPGSPSASLITGLPGYQAMAIGPGVGTDGPMAAIARRILEAMTVSSLPPSVIDADGLNILTTIIDWPSKIKTECVLTPHPGEMSRLTGRPISDIERDRVLISLASAAKWGKVVVLKGSHTVVAAPDGRLAISGGSNPALASAGTGDVLTGIISGLLAQGLSSFDAAVCGVFLHSEAGILAASSIGNAGVLASDLLPLIPRVMKDFRWRQ
jgi:hydroxyethylthiazole kinase-like uncharacterized protein yjeF